MLVVPDASSVGIFLNTDSTVDDLMDQVRRLASDEGVPAYLVGGPVRDHLLGLALNDLDISVVGDAPALAARLADDVGGKLTVHQRFGTATVTTENASVDLVTARSETYARPGALPDVRVGSIGDDLARRDFTINAMAIPLAGDSRSLVDLHGGSDDLTAGVVRTLHANSFVDDATRMFRAARYSSRLGFSISGETADEISRALANGVMGTISGDRVRHEFERFFSEPHPEGALRVADGLGVLTAVHPNLTTSHIRAHESAAHSLSDGAWLSALTWGLNKDEGASFTARLNAPSDWARIIADTGALAGHMPELSRPDLVPSEVCGLLDGLSTDVLGAARWLAPDVARSYIERYLAQWWSTAPILRGDDLLELGVPAGPAVGEALRALRKARLDGETQTRRDEEVLARRWATRPI